MDDELKVHDDLVLDVEHGEVLRQVDIFNELEHGHEVEVDIIEVDDETDEVDDQVIFIQVL